MTNNSTESNKNPESGFNKDMTTDTPRTDAYQYANYIFNHYDPRSHKDKLSLAKSLIENGYGSKAEVEFWKAKAYEAEASEGKHEAEVERLNGLLSDLLILTEKIYWNSNNYKQIKKAYTLPSLKEKLTTISLNPTI